MEDIKEEIKEVQEDKEEKSLGTINGKEVKNIQIRCSKHGIINNGSYFTNYTTYKQDPNDKEKTVAVEHNNIFCIECLNELYTYFQKLPLKNESGETIYQKDGEGKTILDDKGNPVPETMIGNITLGVEFSEDEESEKASEPEVEAPKPKAMEV